MNIKYHHIMMMMLIIISCLLTKQANAQVYCSLNERETQITCQNLKTGKVISTYPNFKIGDTPPINYFGTDTKAPIKRQPNNPMQIECDIALGCFK